MAHPRAIKQTIPTNPIERETSITTTASGNKKLKATPFAGFVPIARFDHRLVEIILKRVRPSAMTHSRFLQTVNDSAPSITSLQSHRRGNSVPKATRPLTLAGSVIRY